MVTYVTSTLQIKRERKERGNQNFFFIHFSLLASSFTSLSDETLNRGSESIVSMVPTRQIIRFSFSIFTLWQQKQGQGWNCREFYSIDHTCCGMLMLWGPRATVSFGTTHLFRASCGRSYETISWTWSGWVPFHKNLSS